MADLTALPNQLDPKTRVCAAIIETPKGSRNKFDYDPESNLFKLGGLLPEGMMFPFDFGFIPSTLGDDGDPLDIMVLMDAPAHVGCLMEVRIIGIIEAEQTEDGKTESNDRLLGVAVHSYNHAGLESINDVNSSCGTRSRPSSSPTTSSGGKNSRSRGQPDRRRRFDSLRRVFERVRPSERRPSRRLGARGAGCQTCRAEIRLGFPASLTLSPQP